MNLQELFHYWHIIKKRLWLIGLLVAATMGTILLVSLYFSKPEYRATASFQVTTPLPTDVSLVNEYRTSTTRDELIYTRSNFLAVLQSEFVVGKVITKLGLPVEPDELLKQVTVEPDETSDFVKLQVVANSPELAADIANSLVETAAQYFGELSAASFTANKQVIQQLLEERKQELDTAKVELVKFQIANRIGSLDGLLTSQERLITTAKEYRDKAVAEGQASVAENYSEIIDTRERELQERVQLNAQYKELQGNVQRVEAAYFSLLDKEMEADLKEKEILSAQFIRVIPARTPSNPLPSLDVRILILASVVSLVVGIVLAFVLEYVEMSRKANALSEAKTAPVFQASWESGKD
jgi:capsular polysaccharide biosynthesis protein